MALNENIVIKLMADSTDYTAKMQAASASATQLSTALERPMSTSERLGATAQKVGLGVGALSLAVGVAAVKAFADFDQSMSAVKTNTGATGAELDHLKQAALDAGAKTVFSATESADAINELAKAGVSTKDILSGGLQGALDLAASGQMGVADAAELTASALNEFGLKGNQASHVADLLAAGAATAQGGVGDMGEALKMVGVTASQTGMSIEDTTGALTMLASKGITGSDAGTQLRSALIGLTSASGPAKKMMQELGISMYDSSGQFVGLANFAGQLKDKLSKLTPEQRANAMGVLFSNAAMSVGNTLYEQGAEGVNKFTKQVNQQGFAAKQAADLTDNLKGDVEQFGGAIETSLIKIGSGANGPLRSVVQHVTDLVTAFGGLPAPVQQATMGIGLAIGAAAGLHKVLGPLSESTSGFARTASLVFDPVQRLQGAFGHFREAGQQITYAVSSYDRQMTRLGSATGRGQLALGALKNVGSGLMDMLGHSWGIALGVAGAALDAWASHAATAKAAANRLSEAMESTGDASGALIDMLRTGEGIDWGWLQHWATGFGSFDDMLAKAGISMARYTEAIMGNKDAAEECKKKIDALAATDEHSTAITEQYEATTGQLTTAMGKGSETSTRAKDAKEELAKADKKGADAAGQHADAQDESAGKTQKAADASSILSTQLGATNKGLTDQAAELGEVVSAMKQYYGFGLSAYDADTKWGKAINDANKSLKENGRTLDAFTPKGEANRDALERLADAAQNSAEAHARNGEGIEKVSKVLDDGRAKIVEYAQKMGMGKGEAEQFADSLGLAGGKAKELYDRVRQVNDAPPLKIKDDASKTLDRVKFKAEALPDGKTIQLKGNDKDFIDKVVRATGVHIDPKTSTLTLNTEQFDVAMAIAQGAVIEPKTGMLKGNTKDLEQKLLEANGWKIEPKTGMLKGDNSPLAMKMAEANGWKIELKTGYIKGDNTEYSRKVAEANGWRIDPETGYIYGNNADMWKHVADANGWKIEPKTGYIHCDDGEVLRAKQDIDSIPNQQTKSLTISRRIIEEHIITGGSGSKSDIPGMPGGPRMATGGLVIGPGTGTSDSVAARLSAGEYVITADKVKAFGIQFFDAINAGVYRRYATGGYVQRYAAAPVPASVVPSKTETSGLVIHNVFQVEGGVDAGLVAARLEARQRRAVLASGGGAW